MNTTLKTKEELEKTISQVRQLGWPLVEDSPKNWDTLATVSEIRRHTTRASAVLDAGAERYSRVLPWLRLCGYSNLEGCNLTFSDSFVSCRIRYSRADITRTHYPPDRFEAIACMSVIEHGVNLRAYFAEMYRILKPGGILITSTDYWQDPIDCGGHSMYGAPVRVFDRADIQDMLSIATTAGMSLTGPIDLTCKDRVVSWDLFQLKYTFLVFALQKPA